MTFSFSTPYSPTREGGTRLFSLSQQVAELAQLLLAPEPCVLRPPFVVHRVESHDDASRVPNLLELDHRLHLVRLHAGDEVGDVSVHEARRWVDLDEDDVLFRGNRHAGLLHVLDLVRSDRLHHVEVLSARAEVELGDLDLEPVRAHPRLDSIFGGPKLPDLLRRCFVRPIQAELWTDLHPTGVPL